MLGAIHGFWCKTRTWPTRCPSCTESIFFFMCNCGSRVFFDQLGSPWPIHNCDNTWARKLQRTTDKTGKIKVSLSPDVTVIRIPRSFGIEQDIISRAQTAKTKQTLDPIVAVEPTKSSSKAIVGVLREITKSADPAKVFKLDNTTMAYALLGPVGRQPVGKITVHAPSASGTQQESFNVWIPSTLIKDTRIVRGLTVSLTLEGIPVLGSGYTWFCDSFDILG